MHVEYGHVGERTGTSRAASTTSINAQVAHALCPHGISRTTSPVCYDTGPALPGPTLRTDLDTKVHAAQARVLASAVHDHSLSLY
jgi:hypothetical protein